MPLLVLILFSLFLFHADLVRASEIKGADGRHVLERFEYDLSWLGVKVGTGVLEVSRDDSGNRWFTSTAKSIEWMTKLYPVDNFGRSVLDETGYPVYFENIQREGSYRGHKEIWFERGLVRYQDHITGAVHNFSNNDRYFDVLSAFLSFRRIYVNPGESISLPVFDEGKPTRTTVRVLRTETLETVVGKIETILIEPRFATSGLFRHKEPLYIWLTNDHRRIPVRLEAQILVGKVRATLREAAYE